MEQSTKDPRATGGIGLVSDPRKLGPAWTQQYQRLAERVADLLPTKKGIILEVGCGRGQLTIPLAKLVPRHLFICIDRFRGPYSKDYHKLHQRISQNSLRRRIRVVASDYAQWLSREPDDKYDAALSSVFLPEIDSRSLESFLAENFRILKPGGVTVQLFLSPVPRNPRQRLLIEADSNPRWTKDPPIEWFSPLPRLVVASLEKAGFRRMLALRLRSNLAVKGEAAKALLKEWGVRDIFWRAHRKLMSERGLEIPDWTILSGVKPPG